jgi:hypothetical protein
MAVPNAPHPAVIIAVHRKAVCIPGGIPVSFVQGLEAFMVPRCEPETLGHAGCGRPKEHRLGLRARLGHKPDAQLGVIVVGELPSGLVQWVPLRPVAEVTNLENARYTDPMSHSPGSSQHERGQQSAMEVTEDQEMLHLLFPTTYGATVIRAANRAELLKKLTGTTQSIMESVRFSMIRASR